MKQEAWFVLTAALLIISGCCGPFHTQQKDSEYIEKKSKGKNMAQQLLTVGAIAPDFTLRDQDGNERSLTNYRGKTVALYFYPRDNTPGCTRQACSLRNGYKELSDAGITVLGISPDAPENHVQFQKTFNLPFTLLCDPDKKVAEQYGALRNFFLVTIPKRVTFIINPNGIVTHVISKVSVDSHAEQIIHTLATNK